MIPAIETKKGRLQNPGVYSLETSLAPRNYPPRRVMEVTMETPKDIQQQIKLTQRKSQAAVGASSAPRIDEVTTPSQVTLAPSMCVIDSFEAPNPLPAGFKECRKKVEKDRKASRPLSSRRVDRLEESLYWLVSAAMLVCLLLGVISR